MTTNTTKCNCCNTEMVKGFFDEDKEKFYCTTECLDKVYKPSTKEKLLANGTLSYLDKIQSDVYEIYDNQYTTLEVAQYIQDQFGNIYEKIKNKVFDDSKPIFTVVDGVQVFVHVKS